MGETFRPVHEMLDAGLFQHRAKRQRGLHEGGELVPILGQLQKGAVAFGAKGVPAFGVRFKAADHQPTGIALDIDAGVKVANDRHRVGQAGDRVGHHIHMLDRLQGQRNAKRIGQGLRPGPGADRHGIGFKDRAVGQAHTRGAAAGQQDIGHLGPLADIDAHGLGRARIGHTQINRVYIAILGHGHHTRMARQVEQGEIDHVGRQDRRRQPHMRAQRGNPVQLIHPFGAARQPIATGAAVAGGHAGLGLEPGEQFQRVRGQPGHVGRGPERPDDPCRMPRGAAGQLVALQQGNIRRAALGQVIGHRQADRAAAYDDRPGHAGASGVGQSGPGSNPGRVRAGKWGLSGFGCFVNPLLITCL